MHFLKLTIGDFESRNANWSSFLLCCCIVFFVTSCQQEDLIDQEINKEFIDVDEQEILDFFADQSFDLDFVRFKESLVFYNYSAWEKEHLLQRIRGGYETDLTDVTGNQSTVATDRQRGILSEFREDAVSTENVNTIHYFIRPSVEEDCGNRWVNAIVEAAEEWTDIKDCEIGMQRTNDESSANIVLASDLDNDIPEGMKDIPRGAFGAGLQSRDGEAGSFIVINASINFLPQRKMLMMKLFGINLGFLPTNGTEGEHIPNTPRTERGSIHNLTALQTTPGFKPGDIYAARSYYPQGYATPEIIQTTSAKPGWLNLGYWNPLPQNHPYYYIKVNRYDDRGNFIDRAYFESEPTTKGYDGIDWNTIPPGVYQFGVQGVNFRRDKASLESPRVTVDLR